MPDSRLCVNETQLIHLVDGRGGRGKKVFNNIQKTFSIHDPFPAASGNMGPTSECLSVEFKCRKTVS